MCVALPPTHVGGCTLYVGRSTMDDELLKIVDFSHDSISFITQILSISEKYKSPL